MSVIQCAACSASIKSYPRRKTNLCRPCFARKQALDPVKRARCSEAMKARLADPEERKLQRQRTMAGLRRAWREDPAFRQERRENGRRLGLSGRGAPTLPAGSEPRIRAGRNSSRTKLAWCPLEYRELYASLVGKHLGPGVARKAVEEKMAVDAARYARTGALQQSAQVSA